MKRVPWINPRELTTRCGEAEAEEEVARIHAADARRPVLENVPTTNHTRADINNM
jgi:hypothetical protein